MPKPRYTQIDIEATRYYHCIGRCVRRAFLCGSDRVTGRNFDHRKSWVVEKLAALSSIFAIRLCAYAVLSNHFHLVVRIDSERASAWSAAEVVERYGRLFPGTAKLWEHLTPAQQGEQIARWRARLADLSWRRTSRDRACAMPGPGGGTSTKPDIESVGLLTDSNSVLNIGFPTNNDCFGPHDSFECSTALGTGSCE